MNINVKVIAVLFCVGVGCASATTESDFFARDISTRIERLEIYPLEQQYTIFLYGNQKIHPPTTGLAVALAKRGKPALDYVLKQLEASQNDLDFRDSLVIIQTMQWGGYYEICDDKVVMQKLQNNANKIQSKEWLSIYQDMLSRVCRPKR